MPCAGYRQGFLCHHLRESEPRGSNTGNQGVFGGGHYSLGLSLLDGCSLPKTARLLTQMASGFHMSMGVTSSRLLRRRESDSQFRILPRHLDVLDGALLRSEEAGLSHCPRLQRRSLGPRAIGSCSSRAFEGAKTALRWVGPTWSPLLLGRAIRSRGPGQARCLQVWRARIEPRSGTGEARVGPKACRKPALHEAVPGV